jgi:O-antigen/teichoic acid export membrane protein
MTAAVKHSVRRTLVCLGTGVLVQRLCQLLGFVLIGRALGVTGLGIYAECQALAAVLTVFAGAGVRNLTARALAAEPAAAQAVVARAVRLRLGLGLGQLAIVGAVAFATSSQPWFWLLCALQVVPAAFDLKQLLDASGRTGSEVRLETATAALQLLAVAGWLQVGGARLDVLAAIALATRCLYALGAVAAIARLPRSVAAAPPRERRLGLPLAQTAHELLTIGDIWLVALALGDAAAGLYAVGVRFAAAALLPSSQLARLLLPHLLHAGADGDAARTLATALRTTLLVTLPMLAGGAVCAPALCRLSGDDFVAAAPALRLLLVAGCMQHVGWQCSHALLALRRDTTYAHSLGWPALGQFAWLLALSLDSGLAAADAATLGAAGAAVAQGSYLLLGLAITRSLWQGQRQLWRNPLRLSLLCGGGALLPVPFVDSSWLLPLQLASGTITFAAGLWWFELRGRWHRLGDGLAAASGFGT